MKSQSIKSLELRLHRADYDYLAPGAYIGAAPAGANPAGAGDAGPPGPGAAPGPPVGFPKAPILMRFLACSCAALASLFAAEEHAKNLIKILGVLLRCPCILVCS